MYLPILLQAFAFVLGLFALFFIGRALQKHVKTWPASARRNGWIGLGIGLIATVAFFLGNFSYPLHFAMPPSMQSMSMDRKPASIPLSKLLYFFTTADLETVDTIGQDPNNVPAPITRTDPSTVTISVRAKEVLAEIAPGITFNYWTYDGQVPGPMHRVRVGDSIILSLTNDPSSLHPHNIDLHAVTGPGGGASVTTAQPGETKTFQWLAKNPGLYVYHCATSNVSTHNAHGQYGLILVEPEGGLPAVDKEFYIMQGELYTMGGIGKKGLVAFDSNALLDGNPTYITFNGAIESTPRMKARVGDRVRMYVGNGGVNLISSFHVIGEIFDTVYPEAAIGEGSMLFKNVQTTAVLPGGAAIVEFTVDVPGKYLLVDHALARMNKGAWAVLEIEGDPQPNIFQAK